MSYLYNCAILLAIIFANVKAYWAASNVETRLQPVSGLYVQPSVDGTTGDLYVAATEDSGVQTQWVADQPINILPTGASAQTQQATPTVSYTPSLSPSTPSQGENLLALQKRMFIMNPLQYALATAIPMSASNGDTTMMNPYPYAMAAMNTLPAEADASKTQISTETLPTKIIQTRTQYMPLQLLYPSLLNTESSSSDDTNKNISKLDGSTPQLSVWPYPYSYPTMQYIAMNPSVWGQSQAAVVSGTSPSQADTPVASNNEHIQTV